MNRPNKHTFTATIQNAGGGGAFVEVPFDVEAAFGAKKPKVKAMIEEFPIAAHWCGWEVNVTYSSS